MSTLSESTRRLPAYQALADGIRADITSGRLRPGDRLPTEPQLGARSGVSRSTVREALRLLASQHLIVTTRGTSGGSFVAHPSPDKLADTLATGIGMLISAEAVSATHLLEVREMLEVPAAAMAARRRTPNDLGALRAAMFVPETDSEETIQRAHRAFHLAIAAGTHNPLFQVVSRPLYSVANERELAASAGPALWPRIDVEHRAILRSIVDRDPAGAAEAARTHLAHLRTVFTS